MAQSSSAATAVPKKLPTGTATKPPEVGMSPNLNSLRFVRIKPDDIHDDALVGMKKLLEWVKKWEHEEEKAREKANAILDGDQMSVPIILDCNNNLLIGAEQFVAAKRFRKSEVDCIALPAVEGYDSNTLVMVLETIIEMCEWQIARYREQRPEINFEQRLKLHYLMHNIRESLHYLEKDFLSILPPSKEDE